MRVCRFGVMLLVCAAMSVASCAPETATSSKAPGKSRVLVFTEKNFEEEVLKSAKPVLVDFWAPWCGPCKLIAPAVETLSVTHAAMLKVGKVNIDAAGGLAAEYRASRIPLLVLFKDGKELDRFEGVPRDNREAIITAWVEETLAAAK
jgi:thioredoxin 1